MGKWEDKGNGSFEKVSGLFFADMTEFDDDGLQWEVWIHSRFGERTPKVAQCHFSSTREEAEAWSDAALFAFNAAHTDPRRVADLIRKAEQDG